MKKILLLFIFLAFSPFAKAEDNSIYWDYGSIYSDVVFPESIAKNENNIAPEDNARLKRVEVSAFNILGLVEIGEAGINNAVRKAGINKIYHVDRQISKVYIPFFFIPIYAKQKKTIVYGE